MINEASLLLARRYATAFLSLFAQKITSDHCTAINKAVAQLRAPEGKSWLLFFYAPDITVEQQQAMLTALLKRVELPEYFDQLGLLLCAHKRLELLPEILNKIVEQFLAQQDVVECVITSFPALAPEQLQKIVNFLEEKSGKKIQVRTKIDNQLIAGVRAQSPAFLWEYSIAKKLRDAQHIELKTRGV